MTYHIIVYNNHGTLSQSVRELLCVPNTTARLSQKVRELLDVPNIVTVYVYCVLANTHRFC